MPTYPYHCNHCDYEVDHFSKIANRDQLVACNCPKCNIGTLERTVTCAPLADALRMGMLKPSSQMTDVLKRIHERNPGSLIDQGTGLGRIN